MWSLVAIEEWLRSLSHSVSTLATHGTLWSRSRTADFLLLLHQTALHWGHDEITVTHFAQCSEARRHWVNVLCLVVSRRHDLELVVDNIVVKHLLKKDINYKKSGINLYMQIQRTIESTQIYLYIILLSSINLNYAI